HNNHHADPHSASFKAKWYEFDIGWVYLRLLSVFGLAEIAYARR
ncbi:MAG: fatty acid desaturase, partial [Gemmatimonadaceae bacterium]